MDYMETLADKYYAEEPTIYEACRSWIEYEIREGNSPRETAISILEKMHEVFTSKRAVEIMGDAASTHLDAENGDGPYGGVVYSVDYKKCLEDLCVVIGITEEGPDPLSGDQPVGPSRGETDLSDGFGCSSCEG